MNDHPSAVPTPRISGATGSAAVPGPPLAKAAPTGSAPKADLPSGVTALARDRVLLYTRGMDLDPLTSVQLGLDSLRRTSVTPCSPEDAQLGTAMAELRALLHERALPHPLLGEDGLRLSCIPPLNRTRMIAEEMDRNPLGSALRRLWRRLFGTRSQSGHDSHDSQSSPTSQSSQFSHTDTATAATSSASSKTQTAPTTSPAGGTPPPDAPPRN